MGFYRGSPVVGGEVVINSHGSPGLNLTVPGA